MDLGLKGKVAVITGGGAGIGKATALEFAREGCAVAICGRTLDKMKDAKKELEALGCKVYIEVVDVSSIKELERFAENTYNTLGHIDFWINNAGIAFLKKIEDVMEEDWDKMMSINMKAVFFGSKIATKYMRMGNRGGVIINISSYASIIPNAARSVYAASKSAVNSLTKTFAAEYAPYGIRVISVLPSGTDTEMSRMLKNPVDNMALRRHATVEEIAKPIVFLTSEAAGYITGTMVDINGGKLAVQRPLSCWDNI